jgi:hypothetical protein
MLNELDRLALAKLKIASIQVGLLLLELKYRPDQARVPAGRREGGQWTREDVAIQAGGKWDEKRRAECELQLESDLFQCRMMPWNPFCENQARLRFTNCMKGDDIPGHFHVM